MGLISSIVAPIKGAIRLGEAIQDQAEQKTFHDPATIRRALERIDEAAAAGELSEGGKTAAQQQVFHRMQRDGP
jgi:hypothetical protein